MKNENIEIESCHYEDAPCSNEVSHVIKYSNGLSECHGGYCEDHFEEALDFLGDNGDCYDIEDWKNRYRIYIMRTETMV